MKGRFAFLLTLLAVMSVSSSWAGDAQPLKPRPADKCPVCGMFVAKYPDFSAQIRFRDGSTAFFDGAKDMLRYYLDLKRFNPAKQKADIAALYVTNYYSLSPINGQAAWYVSGSNVYGPMGHELIPFGKEREAREFMQDHKGKALLRFRDVTPVIIKTLE